ncbi:hypothetical protein CBFG_00004 [Clostridiales bacterium 1_7_47FAA]|uniref:Uncharacterized protein n=1 Tax=Enterocloster hominis (ex Hitch et al. 2024) TaxID=1917870 RepID=A0ABV1D7K9_9FIRM|nr:hypothetical protein CBFG_00004 [Clostridiales bacterium 1_7_47FAA]
MDRSLQKEFNGQVSEWEWELYRRNMKRMYKTARSCRDPREKALEDYRHRRGTKWFYKHECKEVRRQTRRSLRIKLKRELYNEAYYRVVPHDYKTYGWLTW